MVARRPALTVFAATQLRRYRTQMSKIQSAFYTLRRVLTAGGTAELEKFYAEFEIERTYPYAWTRLIKGVEQAAVPAPSTLRPLFCLSISW